MADDLVTQHEEVADQILASRSVTLTEWTLVNFGGDNGEPLVVAKQYIKLCKPLVQARRIGAVRSKRRTALSVLRDRKF